jgi:hypothetical protein
MVGILKFDPGHCGLIESNILDTVISRFHLIFSARPVPVAQS